MKSYFLTSGRPLSLGRLIGRGKEGHVYELTDDADWLAKIHHRPNAALRTKLIAMVQMRSADLERVAAWPIDLIQGRQKEYVGFVMSRVVAPGDIDQLSHPAEQRIAFPTVDYGFLLHAAMNLMRAAATLHSAGCVLGDVSQSNVRIHKDGTVRFIDIDSIQITANGSVFPCTVGTPMFTPRELHNRQFEDLQRTPNHDSFGLAVLVFQLLMCGRHPFAGVRKDGGGDTIEHAIRDGLYAYSARLADRILPPPRTLPIQSLGVLAPLFERAFTSTDRPTAVEWMHALDRVRSRLRPCGRNERHAIVESNSSCPLCALAVDPLPSIGQDYAASSVDVGSLSIAELLHEAGKLSPPKRLTSACKEAVVPASARTPPSSPRYALCEKLIEFGAWSAGIGFVLGVFCVGLGDFRLTVLIAGVAIGAALAIIGHAIRASEQERVRAIEHEFAKAMKDLDIAEAQAAVKVRLCETNTGELWTIICDARAFICEGDARLREELSRIDDTYRKERLKQYLETFLVSRARITDIGPNRCATLASFGVETAADIDTNRIRRIPGFGPKRTKYLLEWRKECERGFRGRNSMVAPPERVDRARREHQAKMVERANRLREAIDKYCQEVQTANIVIGREAKAVDDARRRFRHVCARL